MFGRLTENVHDGALQVATFDGRLIRRRSAPVTLSSAVSRPDTPDLDPAGAGSVDLSHKIDTKHIYSSDGLDKILTLGPERTVELSTGALVQARQAVRTTYDEGNPYSYPLHLKTTEEVSDQQAEQLKRAHGELGSVLNSLGLIEEPTRPPVDPQWYRDTAKQWALLNAVFTEHNGDVGSEQWSRLGRHHGYDPRGLGGFFVGSKPLMASQGVRRVLTEHGRRFVERWRDDFTSN